MALVVLSYREVVMVYTGAGGSYVVARENFGPRVAQIAAVALLIDYVVTVAVQIAAGTVAVVSAVPALGPYTEPITVGVVAAHVLRQPARASGRPGGSSRCPPTCSPARSILMIVVGLVREVLGDLPKYDPHALLGTYPIGAGTAGILTFAMILTLLRAFANGGSSLTGIEAISNAVSAFRPPEGINARQVLVTEGVILGFLVAGVSWLAHETHATPVRRAATRRCSPRRPRRSSAARLAGPRAVPARAGGHRADPVHRRQHQLQRVPVPGQLRGRGRASCRAG